jgi:hypothetical protein
VLDPRRILLVLMVAAALSPLACASEAENENESEEPIGRASSELVATDTVADAVAQSCTTTAVKGLAVQLVEEIQCLRPSTFMRIDNTAGLSLGSAVFPYLQTKAAQGLLAAQKARGTTMTINSALRTLPQQFLLYRWYQTGRCGIGLAAAPGTSNHEGAIALDINDTTGWRASLTNKGFRWLGASDPVHYDFVGGGTVDLKGLSVRAFQRLWNRNHPTDTIAEDGVYGGGTATRLSQSPVGGFAKGADCTKSTDAGADAAPSDDGGEPAATPASVPAIPDATEGDGEDNGASSAPSSVSGNGPQTRPTPEATGCAVMGGRAGGSDGALGPSALLLAFALSLAGRRRGGCVRPRRGPPGRRACRRAPRGRRP